MSAQPGAEVRRAGDRFVAAAGGRDARYSFSFGDFYDPGNTSFGLLVACNEIQVAPGCGFEPHEHRDMEIVTWVLDGALAHRDATGTSGVTVPGQVQRLSAGRGTVHSETCASSRPVRFVQMWVTPDVPGQQPSYEQRGVDDRLEGGRLVPVASGIAAQDAAVSLGQRQAALHVARLRPGGNVRLPAAPYLHVFVARGSVTVDGAGSLATGDAVRLTGPGGQQITAPAPAELLVWEMHTDVASTHS